MPNVVPKYKGSMKLFYLVVEVIFSLLKGNIDRFKALKGLYTTGYVDDLEAKLAAARALPSTSKGIAKRGNARVDLENAAGMLRLKWQILKTHITKGVEPDKLEWALKEAGWEYYGQRVCIWGANQQMAVAAVAYINEHKAELEANDNMPDTFVAEFEAAAKKYNDLLAVFTKANDVKLNIKKAKIEANNVLQDAISNISRDAVVIFRSEERSKFSYSYQYSVLKGGACQFKGTITDSVTGKPIEGASINNGSYATVTNSRGYFKITRMLASDYSFNVVHENFQPLQEEVTLEAGTAKTVHLEMVAI